MEINHNNRVLGFTLVLVVLGVHMLWTRVTTR